MTRCSDLSYRLLAARHLRRQAKQLAEHLGGIRQGDDIESVHRARVASRRLRAGLRMFRNCWKRKKVKRWRREIREITQALGGARDKDVQIEFLCGILGAMAEKSYAPGIVRLLAQLERQRELMQPGVLKAIEHLEQSKVLNQIQMTAKKLLAHADAEAAGHSGFVCDQTRRFIVDHLKEMLYDQDSLEDPADYRRHHAMRIAAKRLRYILEIAKPVYAGQVDDIIETTKRVQSMLGDVHDCDVWLQLLEAFSRQECGRVQMYFGTAGRCARLKAGIEYLQQERSERRGQIFQALVAYWRQLKEQAVWDRLLQVVETEPAPTGVCAPAAAATPALPVAEPAPVAPAGQPAAPAIEPDVNTVANGGADVHAGNGRRPKKRGKARIA